MSDAPFFPPPRTTKVDQPGPYREPAPHEPQPEERPSTTNRIGPPPKRPTKIEDAAVRRQAIDAIVAARAQRKRSALLTLVVGGALMTFGVIVTLVSRGQLIWYGAAVSGILMMMRGVVALTQLATASKE